MKKLIIVLLVLLAFTPSIPASAATPYELDQPYAYEYFQVGTNEDNVKVSINNDYGNNLFITMRLSDQSIDSIIPFINGSKQATVPINKHDSDNWIEIALSSIPGEKADISLAVQRGTRLAISGAGVIEFGIIKNGSRWELDVNENVVKHNKELFRNNNSPSEAMGSVSQEITDVSDSIVGNETDPRKIVQLIYDWVCNNIYYNRAADSNHPALPEKVLESKYAECMGYSNLTKALLLAQNIPCNVVYGYVYGVATPGGGVPETVPIEGMNDILGDLHAWNEAYVDGEWLLMDSTWDSSNIYNGANNFEKSEGPATHYYFNPSLVYFSKTHIIVSRDVKAPSNDDKPSSWADKEVKKAVKMNIIPSYLQNNYTNGITRKEFASLVVAAIKKDMGSVLFKLDLDKSQQYNAKVFNDTVDPDVIMAYMSNVVGGKGNGRYAPDDLITRQEAAVMLYRTAKEIRYYDGWNIKKSSFADDNKIADWAKEAVNLVSSAVDNEYGKQIMGGVGDNAFNPNGIYTREQAFITFGRLYNMTFSE